MDDFGYGAAAKAALSVFEDASRQSGRTTRTLTALPPGSRFIVRNEKMAQWAREVAPKGVTVTSDGDRPEGLRPVSGDTVLDHTVVLRMYLDAINDVSRRIRADYHPYEEMGTVRNIAGEPNRLRR